MQKHLFSLLLTKRNISLLIISLILALTGMAIVLYEPQVLGKIIDYLTSKNTKSLQSLVILYILCSIIGNISVNICKFLISRINIYLTTDLRNLFFSRVISAKVPNIESLSNGDLISKFETDISIVANFLTGNAVDFLINIFSVFLIAVYMFNINFILSILLLIFIPLEIIIIKKLGKISKKNSESFRKLNSKYLSFFENSIIGIKDIKSFGREKQIKNTMRTELTHLFSLANKAAYIDVFINIINKIFLLAINILVIIFFIPKIMNDNITIGLFIAFFNYSSKFYSAFFGLTGIYTKWKITSVSLKRVIDLFDIPQELSLHTQLTPSSNNIYMDNISFSYSNENAVFKNFDANFKENKVNLIIGKSGIGKTTLCELLLKFYDPDSGDIKYDSLSYSKIDYSFIRKKISYISQSPVFFESSILNNMFINATKENIEYLTTLLKEFNLSDLLENLSEEFNFDSLSVGQRQRLNIIRGILNEASIYIFDEPTSSIDIFNKKIILDKINVLSKNKSVIIITHDNDIINYFEEPNIVSL